MYFRYIYNSLHITKVSGINAEYGTYPEGSGVISHNQIYQHFCRELQKGTLEEIKSINNLTSVQVRFDAQFRKKSLAFGCFCILELQVKDWRCVVNCTFIEQHSRC